MRGRGSKFGLSVIPSMNEAMVFRIDTAWRRLWLAVLILHSGVFVVALSCL